MKDQSLEALGAVPVELVFNADGTVAVSPLAPRIIHEGKYRLYEKPDGSLRIQYQRSDRDEEDFFELPGEMVRLAQAAAEGSVTPAQMMKAVMKMMSHRT